MLFIFVLLKYLSLKILFFQFVIFRQVCLVLSRRQFWEQPESLHSVSAK
jgi:hypothetical protein